MPRLLRAAGRILRSDDLARDAVQETLLSLWQSAPADVDLSGWLNRTVVHRSLHARRTRLRRGKRERCGLDDCLECAASQPSHTLKHRERRGAIEDALAAIPAAQRVVLLMRGLEDLDYEEIAAALGLPLGTVRSRLHRGREALRAALALNENRLERNSPGAFGTYSLKEPIAPRRSPRC